MTYPGAMGDTKTEMAETLNFQLAEEDLHPAFNALDLALDARDEVEVDDGDPPTLRVVNAIWGQMDFPFSTDYLDLLATHYGAGLRVVDFETEPEAVREEINQWVEDQTEERIKDLLPGGSIQPSTRLVLTNAIYFLAGWEKPFPDGGTSDQPFRLRDGTEVETALMSQTENFPFYADEDTRAVSLPYVGGELSLIAMMPADEAGFEDWEAALDRDRFDAVIEGLTIGYGNVKLPRFEVEGDYDLMAIFEAMGWENFSDLRAMLEDGMGGLGITAILHKSFIKLDEEGTEAAAATAVVVGDSEAEVPELEFDMDFDRSFYYAIYDHPTESILFLGRMMDPTN